MTLPLVVLAVFAVIGGFIGISQTSTARNFRPVKPRILRRNSLVEPFMHSPVGVLIGLAFVAAGHFRRLLACTGMPPAIRCPRNLAAWRRR